MRSNQDQGTRRSGQQSLRPTLRTERAASALSCSDRTCPMHPSEVQAIARARISWANVNSIFSLPICDGGQVRLLTRCVLSLTSSHAPHPSASTATKYCTFPCACPPTLRAHGIRPARACAPPLALSLCTTLCTHHLSLFVSFPDRSECELYNEVRYSVWHAGFPIENDSKRYENSFFFRCAGQNDACSKVNFAAVQRTPSRGFSLLRRLTAYA